MQPRPFLCDFRGHQCTDMRCKRGLCMAERSAEREAETAEQERANRIVSQNEQRDLFNALVIAEAHRIAEKRVRERARAEGRRFSDQKRIQLTLELARKPEILEEARKSIRKRKHGQFRAPPGHYTGV